MSTTIGRSAAGLIAAAAYVPCHRLDRAEIAAAFGGRGRGTRAVAGFDEDSTSLAVEATRRALRRAPEGWRPDLLLFSTTAPAYLEKSNAAVIHAALGLDGSAGAYDMVGGVRSGVGAVRAALAAAADGRRVAVVIADIRTGLAGGADESDGGDAAVALLFGWGDGVVAGQIEFTARSAEFIDRFRAPGDVASTVAEDRFGEHLYMPLAEDVLREVRSAAADEGSADLGTVLISGLQARASRAVAKQAPGAQNDGLATSLGNCGAAHPWLRLVAALEEAAAGDALTLVVLADGIDVMRLNVLRAPAWTGRDTVAHAAAGTETLPVAYTSFLTWRGLLQREPPRRPDPDQPSFPAAHRTVDWKFALTATRCRECATRSMPPQRVCSSCHAVDSGCPERLADVGATVATFTVDHLAFSPSPPMIIAAVDFDGGGRIQCELTDVAADSVHIGQRVDMTFRRLYTAGGVHNYFWKARPTPAATKEDG